ncbi:purine nucleoside phosphorylase-like protein, partial [Hortaea werneckii]
MSSVFPILSTPKLRGGAPQPDASRKPTHLKRCQPAEGQRCPTRQIHRPQEFVEDGHATVCMIMWTDILHHASSIYHSIHHLAHTITDAHDEMAASPYERAKESVEFLRLKLPEQLASPRVAIVCGSGLGGLAQTVNDGIREEWDYKDVPNFPLSTVPGHEGKLIFSTMGQRQVPVVLLVGRAHFYEGHSMDSVTFAMRICRILGVETVLLTNAAGGLNPDYKIGDIVCLNDHINLAGLVGFHPLRGPNEDEFGVRFPPLSDAYDISLRQLVHRSWKELRQQAPSSRRIHEGVYAFVGGPSYETRAECRLLRGLGADLVGMST